MNNYAIILASGLGSRFKKDVPKQFYEINGKTILDYTIEKFQKNCGIAAIIIVANPKYIKETENISYKYTKVKNVINGGETRQLSSYKALQTLTTQNVDNVLIHDGVRPFVTEEIINNCIKALKSYDAINVAIPVTDTIIETEKNIIVKVPDRKKLYKCQTPQCFNYELIKKAHELANNEQYIKATDDCSLILRYNLAKIYVIEGSEINIKITYPIDIHIAKELLAIQ